VKRAGLIVILIALLLTLLVGVQQYGRFGSIRGIFTRREE